MKKKTFEVHFGNICRLKSASNFFEAMILAQAQQIKEGLSYSPDKVVEVHDAEKKEVVWKNKSYGKIN